MGNKSTKSSLRNAIIYLNISADPVCLRDDKFWAQIWTEDVASATEIIKGISNQEIRMLRDGSPKNFASLTYKMVERLCFATGTLCNTQCQQTAVMNATRMLIRIIPCIFEDVAWRNFFNDNCIYSADCGLRGNEPELVFPIKSVHQRNYKSYLPTAEIGAHDYSNHLETEKLANNDIDNNNNDNRTLLKLNNELDLLCDSDAELTNHESASASGFTSSEPERDCQTNRTLTKCLILSICDLLFCPEFTVPPHTDNHLYSTVDAPPEDLKSLSTCDYVWEPGVGFESKANSTAYYDKSRIELLRLILACLSTTLYEIPSSSVKNRNYWLEIFASNMNRHALPIFTSLLNVVFIYKPTKFIPFNHLLFDDTRKELVELAIQILIVTLDYHFYDVPSLYHQSRGNPNDKSNLFIEYMSRIHRSEDFNFIIEGFKRLLNNRLEQGYLVNSIRQINFDQELLILFWRICNLNNKFVNHSLKTRDVLDITVPILHNLNENFQDPTKSALIHIGIFNLLILSGERNFGVQLNKPFVANMLANLPIFNGSHADLMIIVFHKLILYGQNMHQLFDFLLTIVVNVSPYLKALTMVASKCLIQLFEIFSSPFVVFTEPNYHQLVIFLLEIFNNLIQYQFDGNTNLVLSMLIRKETFINLANLPFTTNGIKKVLKKLLKRKQRNEIMEKQLMEKQGNQSRVDESSEKDTKLKSHLSDHTSNGRLRATISSNNTPSSPNMIKQEVSLIETPDICHVTQAMHPFDMDNNNITTTNTTIGSNNSQQYFFGPNHQQNEVPSINFDDILDHQTTFNGRSESVDAGSSSIRKEKLKTTSSPESLIGSQSLEENYDDKQTLVVEETNNIVYVNPKPESNETNSGSKWRPTPDWVKQWKQSLPLHTSLRMIEVLSPQLERFKQEHQGQVDEAEVMKFLQSGTLVGLLPVPHPILIRKYRTNSETALWFRACTWGIIYVRNTIWTNTDIKLIKIV